MNHIMKGLGLSAKDISLINKLEEGGWKLSLIT